MIAWQASTSPSLRAIAAVGRLRRARLGEHGLGRRHHERVAVVRAEVEHLAGGDQVHVAPAVPPNAPTGKPPPIDLASVTRSGCDAEVPGRAAVAGGDAGLDLVEDQQRAVALGDLAHRLEVAGLRAGRCRCSPSPARR